MQQFELEGQIDKVLSGVHNICGLTDEDGLDTKLKRIASVIEVLNGLPEPLEDMVKKLVTGRGPELPEVENIPPMENDRKLMEKDKWTKSSSVNSEIKTERLPFHTSSSTVQSVNHVVRQEMEKPPVTNSSRGANTHPYTCKWCGERFYRHFVFSNHRESFPDGKCRIETKDSTIVTPDTSTITGAFGRWKCVLCCHTSRTLLQAMKHTWEEHRKKRVDNSRDVAVEGKDRFPLALDDDAGVAQQKVSWPMCKEGGCKMFFSSFTDLLDHRKRFHSGAKVTCSSLLKGTLSPRHDNLVNSESNVKSRKRHWSETTRKDMDYRLIPLETMSKPVPNIKPMSIIDPRLHKSSRDMNDHEVRKPSNKTIKIPLERRSKTPQHTMSRADFDESRITEAVESTLDDPRDRICYLCNMRFATIKDKVLHDCTRHNRERMYEIGSTPVSKRNDFSMSPKKTTRQKRRRPYNYYDVINVNKTRIRNLAPR